MIELSARDIPGGQWLHRLHKEQLKSALFNALPGVFSRVAAYHNWVAASDFRDGWAPDSLTTWLQRQWMLYDAVDYSGVLPVQGEPIDRIAVVIHAFYPDVLDALMVQLAAAHLPGLQLFVTSPPEVLSNAAQILQRHPLPYKLLEVANRGRDILPFLEVLPLVIAQGFPLMLKLHTKRDNHRNTRRLWQHELFDALLQPEGAANHLNVFEHFPHLGMLGPERNLLPMGMYYGANAQRVREACCRLDLDKQQRSRLCFVAGSMFYARPEALRPLLSLGYGPNDFEEEAGQYDGTLAHVIERVAGASVQHSGYILADTGSTPERLQAHIYFAHNHVY